MNSRLCRDIFKLVLVGNFVFISLALAGNGAKPVNSCKNSMNSSNPDLNREGFKSNRYKHWETLEENVKCDQARLINKESFKTASQSQNYKNIFNYVQKKRLDIRVKTETNGLKSTKITDGVIRIDGLKFRDIPETLGEEYRLISSTAKYIFVKATQENRYTDVWRFSKSDPKQEPIKVISETADKLFAKVFVKNNRLIASTFSGFERFIEINDLNGKLLQKITTPDMASVKSVGWKSVDKILMVKFENALHSKRAFLYDLELNKWQSDLSKLLIYENVKYETFILQTKTHDGEILPLRITKRADIPINQDSKIFMQVYGGWSFVDFFHPFYNFMNREFLIRGGIHVAPAIRGGGEFGHKWHKAALGSKKVNTFLDITSSAEFLNQELGIQANNIVLYGSSQGGSNVAMAMSMRPELFGMVIGVNGIYDLLSKRLNEEGGWDFSSKQYSDLPADQVSLSDISPISPLENISSSAKYPKVLLFAGAKDTVVPSEHSFKYYEALKDNGHSVEFFPFPKKQHSNIFKWQDETNDKARAIMWSQIYDHLQIKF